MDPDRLRKLRDRADEILDQHRDIIESDLTQKEVIEKLQIYQAELEAQHDELLDQEAESRNLRLQFQEIFDNSPVGYLIITPDGKILVHNFAARELLDIPGYMRSGVTLQQSIPGHFGIELFKWLVGQSTEAIELQVSSDALKWLKFQRSPLEKDRYLITVINISEAKQKSLETEKHLEERKVLTQEIHHRVKNNMQVILSMLSLQSRSAQGEHEVHALNESSRRVRVMAKLYEHLYQSDNVSDIGPKEYLSEVLNDALHAAGAPDDVEANLDCDDVTLKIKTATALAQVISELISNCLKHAFPDGKGQIDVSLKRLNEKELCLSVSDDGVGLPDGFDEKKLKSMGMKLVNALVMQIGGTKQIKSKGGTTVEITFEENN